MSIGILMPQSCRGGVGGHMYRWKDVTWVQMYRQTGAYGKGWPTGHDLSKVSLGPAMPYPSTPCGRAAQEIALRPFQGWPTHSAGVLRLYYTPLDTRRRMPVQTDDMLPRNVGGQIEKRFLFING
jgi:hypothetical protein